MDCGVALVMVDGGGHRIGGVRHTLPSLLLVVM